MKAARWKLTWLMSLGILQALALSLFGQLPTSIDLRDQDVDFTVISRDGGDGVGSPNAMALGDFNDDGIVDLLVGAPGGDGPDDRRKDAGEAYVIFGRPNLPPSFDVDGVPGPDVVIFGKDPGDLLGSGVAAGDLNGDGIDDILLGAPGGDGPSNSRDSVGEAVVIAGGSGLSTKIDLAKSSPLLTVFNNRQRSRFGAAMVSLDMNGDGIGDMIIADPAANGNTGSAYVIYGKRGNLPTRIDVSDPSGPDVVIKGADFSDRMGSTLAGGDLNNDRIEDLVIGAPLADGPADARIDGGEAYVILGRVNLPRVIDLSATSADITMYGADAQDQLGTSVAIGDVNGDRVPDLLVGAPGASGPSNKRGAAGEAYVVYGKPQLRSVFDIGDNSQDVTIIGAQSLDGVGSAVAAADLDLDGFQDLILGARGGRGPDGSRAGAGNVYVVHSAGNLPAVIDFADNLANLIIYGAKSSDALGSALAGADISGTGEGFLLMGAPGVDSPGDGADAGAVYALKAAKLIQPNLPPVANAGFDQTVPKNTTVQLDGSGSSDPDGDPLTFAWVFLSKPAGSSAGLLHADAQTPSFTVDVAGDYVVQLTVDDGRGGTSSDQVTISTQKALKGDVDGDGTITILDARLVCEYVLGLRTLTPEQIEQADVAPPFGTITMDDAQYIAEAVVGLRTLEASTSGSSAAPLRVQSWKALSHRTSIEFHALGAGVESMKVEVYTLAGQIAYRSPWVTGDRVLWEPAQRSTLLANGVYLYVLTARGSNGELVRSSIGKFLILR